jgi:hypothetical protein
MVEINHDNKIQWPGALASFLWWHPRPAGRFGRRARNHRQTEIANIRSIAKRLTLADTIRRDAKLNLRDAGATSIVGRRVSNV